MVDLPVNFMCALHNISQHSSDVHSFCEQSTPVSSTVVAISHHKSKEDGYKHHNHCHNQTAHLYIKKTWPSI